MWQEASSKRCNAAAVNIYWTRSDP